MTRTTVDTPKATAVGPYSHAVAAGEFLYLSGQTPLDGTTGALVEGGVGVQTAQCLTNLAAVLDAAGLDFGHVVKATVFLTDMSDFPEMSAVYESHFDAPFPARTTIGVAALPLGARVEIEMIAWTG